MTGEKANPVFSSFKTLSPAIPAVFAYNRNDLRDNPELEYSGIYEDGWVSEHSFCRLSQRGGAAPAGTRAAVKGEVPALPGGDPNFETLAELCVDGRIVAREVLRPGDFELSGDVPPATTPEAGSIHAVELKFSRLQHVPMNNGDPDGRPVAARLHYVGLTPATNTSIARSQNR